MTFVYLVYAHIPKKIYNPIIKFLCWRGWKTHPHNKELQNVFKPNVGKEWTDKDVRTYVDKVNASIQKGVIKGVSFFSYEVRSFDNN